MKDSRSERLRELLADQALFGLSPEGERELGSLGATDPEDSHSFELAAAAVHMALLGGGLEPLPDDVRQRVSRILID